MNTSTIAIAALSLFSLTCLLLLVQTMRKIDATSDPLSSEDIRAALKSITNQEFITAMQSLEETSNNRVLQTQQSVDNQNAAAARTVKAIIDPLSTKLNALDTKIAELEAKRLAAYEGVEKGLSGTNEFLQRLQSETNTLANALSNSGARGSWGEIQLEKMIESLGLEEHYGFVQQTAIEGASSKRPDMILELPEHRCIYIDSKFSLTDYQRAVESTDSAERDQHLQAHAKVIKGRINELAKREYDVDKKSLDFVVMFVPTESSLAAALSADPDLLTYAAERKVILVSPTGMYSLLSIVQGSWRYLKQVENESEILNEAKALFDSFVVLLGHFGTLRNSIEGTNKAFNQIIGSLDQNVMPKARDIRNHASLDSTKFDAAEKKLSIIDGESLRESRYEQRDDQTA